MSESSGEIEKRGGTPDVPHLIRAGGEWAVLAYREFLDNPNWSAAKRTVSRNVLGRFCRWAEARGLTLESISASEVKAYFAETPEERYLVPVGDLLRRLAAAGVVTGKPVRRKAMRKKATAVPEIIRAAGERAVAAYREILDDPKWSAGTRRLYGRRARRFFRWAEARGLTLETIAGADAAAYAAEIAARRSPQAANLALTAVRGLFRHLAGSGVISANPFETPRLGSREVSGDVTGSRGSKRKIEELRRDGVCSHELGQKVAWAEATELNKVAGIVWTALSVSLKGPAVPGADTLAAIEREIDYGGLPPLQREMLLDVRAKVDAGALSGPEADPGMDPA